MARVDLVSPVHVCSEEPLLVPLGEDLDLVSRGVRAEHHVPVDVVAVRDGSPGVVGRE